MFVDRLTVTAELSIGASSRSIKAGDIKRFELKIEPWGFTGSAEFWIVNEGDSEDDLFSSFAGRDLVEVTFTIGRAFDTPSKTAATTTLRGIVFERSVTERALADVAKQPVLQRLYAIRFADRAKVVWGQHFPIALYADKSLKELIDDNKPTTMLLEQTWTAATAKHAVLSLALGTEINTASFYDFVHWLLWSHGAGLYWNAETNAYAMLSTKPPAAAPTELSREIVERVEIVLPTLSRASVSVLNAYSEAGTKRKDLPNSDGITGVRVDYVIRSAVSKDLELRSTLETTRAKQHDAELALAFRSFPVTPVLPSDALSFGAPWSANVYQHGKTFRVVQSTIVAHAERQNAGDDSGEPTNSYKIEYEVRAERESDPRFRHPEFRTPVWPVHVEGKIVSDAGKDDEDTYQIYKDEATSLEFYKIKIPLWDDKKIVAPFEPGLVPGHFYFPLYKGERVLVALYFNHAVIVSSLDWKSGARLPADTQGNQILVGKKAKDETSIRHVYEDAKPALIIARSNAADTQTIKVSEGTIRFETKETDG